LGIAKGSIYLPAIERGLPAPWHSAGMLGQLACCSSPWPLFRVLVAGHDYVGMGALWTMRVRHQASVLDLLTQTHRGVIQAAGGCPLLPHSLHPRVWMMSLFSCMDRRTGSMFPRLSARPQSNIYSMLFSVPNYFE